MNYLAFGLFAIIFLAWCSVHLAAAFWAVKKLRNSSSSEIDMGFVRIPDYRAREVREGRAPVQFRAAAFASFPKWSCEGVVVSEGDCLLRCDTKVNAIVSTALLRMKDRVQVRDFADSQGEMILRNDCRIGGPATSAAAIRLGPGSSARSLRAPEITTAAPPEDAPAAPPPEAQPEPAVEFPNPEGRIAGANLHRLSDDTWILKGDLTMSGPLVLRANLVVTGAFRPGPFSVLEGDVKAAGDIEIGPDSRCKGRLVSDRHIRLGGRVRFEHTVSAGGELRLGDGISGGGSSEVVAFSRGRLVLGSGIKVRGKLASDVEVICLPSSVS